MDIDRILNFSSNTGRLMLENGGETYRVEETITRICQAFNVDDVEVFATTTAVIVTVSVDGKINSIVKRIKSRTIDLNKVHLLNNLSREIYANKFTIEECERELEEICIEDNYPIIQTLLASGVATAAFTLLFKGSIVEMVVAFFIGLMTKVILINLEKSSLNTFFITSICGVFISISSIILLETNIINEIDKVIAGCIMLLVPGLALTNSIRDIIDGELVSGLTKAAEVFLIGVSVAIGTGGIIHMYIMKGGI